MLVRVSYEICKHLERNKRKNMFRMEQIKICEKERRKYTEKEKILEMIFPILAVSELDLMR